MNLVIGGCLYRGMLHHRTASTVMGVGMRAPHHGCDGVGVSWRRTSNLPQGRSMWLRDAIAGPADIAISIDGDTEATSDGILVAATKLYRFQSDMVAMAIAPVATSADATNLWVGGRRLSSGDSLPGILDAGGFGLVLFRLAWFRSKWRLPYPEPHGDPDTWINQGEDWQMCKSVTRRGGLITSAAVSTTHLGVGVVRVDHSSSGELMVYSTLEPE